MINTIVFDNEITLYWHKPWELSDDVSYRLSLNGEFVAETKNIHYSFCNLQEKTNYNAGFVSTPRIPQNSTLYRVLFCGGQRWIRTTEVEDVRFTV